MFKSLLGSKGDKFRPLEMQVHRLRSYNEEDLNDLHEKVIELSDQMAYEEYEPAREAMVALMNVYVAAIERILKPMPMVGFPLEPFRFHPNTEDDMVNESKHHEDFIEDLKSSKGEGK